MPEIFSDTYYSFSSKIFLFSKALYNLSLFSSIFALGSTYSILNFLIISNSYSVNNFSSSFGSSTISSFSLFSSNFISASLLLSLFFFGDFEFDLDLLYSSLFFKNS